MFQQPRDERGRSYGLSSSTGLILFGPIQLVAAPLEAGRADDQVAAPFGVSRATLYRNLTERAGEPADDQQ